jgi:hypothetical protein
VLTAEEGWVHARKRLGELLAVVAFTRTVCVPTYTGSGLPLRAPRPGVVPAKQVGDPTGAGAQQSLYILEGHDACVRRFQVRAKPFLCRAVCPATRQASALTA